MGTENFGRHNSEGVTTVSESEKNDLLAEAGVEPGQGRTRAQTFWEAVIVNVAMILLGMAFVWVIARSLMTK